MAIPMTGWVGRELSGNRYVIDHLLGEGGMGFVYRAKDRNLGSTVVIKVPRLEMLQDSDFAFRFGKEIKALVELSHPHIVKIMDAGELDGLPFAVMQCLNGGSLEDQLVDGPDGQIRPQTPKSLIEWLPIIAKTLDFVHSRNIVHRDIKPGNILFDEHGNAYLSDFGIAKTMATSTFNSQSTTMTSAGSVVGTPAYMPYETLMGHAYDGRADQYSLAVTVYEVLAGRRPFEERGPALWMRHGRDEGPPELHTLCPQIAVGLSQAIHRGLAKDQNARYPTCGDFASAVLAELVAIPIAQESAILKCPRCSKQVRVRENLRGELGICQKCGARYRVAGDLSALELREPVSAIPDETVTPIADDIVTPISNKTVVDQLGITITEKMAVEGPTTAAQALPRTEITTTPETPPDSKQPEKSVPPIPSDAIRRRKRILIGSSVAGGTLGFGGLIGILLWSAPNPVDTAPNTSTVSSSSESGDGFDSEPTKEKKKQGGRRPAAAPVLPMVTFQGIAPRTMEQGARVVFRPRMNFANGTTQKVRYRLISGTNQGATIDSDTGMFDWTTDTDTNPGLYQFEIEAALVSNPESRDRRTFTITVNPRQVETRTDRLPVPTGPDEPAESRPLANNSSIPNNGRMGGGLPGVTDSNSEARNKPSEPTSEPDVKPQDAEPAIAKPGAAAKKPAPKAPPMTLAEHVKAIQKQISTIDNHDAKMALTNALNNAGKASSTPTAERFCSNAIKAAPNDADVQSCVHKIKKLCVESRVKGR